MSAVIIIGYTRSWCLYECQLKICKCTAYKRPEVHCKYHNTERCRFTIHGYSPEEQILISFVLWFDNNDDDDGDASTDDGVWTEAVLYGVRTCERLQDHPRPRWSQQRVSTAFSLFSIPAYLYVIIFWQFIRSYYWLLLLRLSLSWLFFSTIYWWINLLHFAWVVDDAKCIVVTRVCVPVCLSVRGRMPTLLHGPGCNLGEW